MIKIMRTAFAAAALLALQVLPSAAEPAYTVEQLVTASPRIRDQIVMQPHVEEHAATYGFGGVPGDAFAAPQLLVSPRIADQGAVAAFNPGQDVAPAVGASSTSCAGLSPRLSGPGIISC